MRFLKHGNAPVTWAVVGANGVRGGGANCTSRIAERNHIFRMENGMHSSTTRDLIEMSTMSEMCHASPRRFLQQVWGARAAAGNRPCCGERAVAPRFSSTTRDTVLPRWPPVTVGLAAAARISTEPRSGRRGLIRRVRRRPPRESPPCISYIHNFPLSTPGSKVTHHNMARDPEHDHASSFRSGLRVSIQRPDHHDIQCGWANR